MNNNSFNDYIESQSNQSFLRKCFVSFIIDDFSRFEEIEDSLDKRNYKSIAGLGFITSKSGEYNEKFEQGINWILGREFSQEDNTLVDDIAILGFLVGLKNIDIKDPQSRWIEKLLNQKARLEKPYQEVYSRFFQLFLNNKNEWLGDSELEVELSLFLKVQQNVKLYNLELVSKYFIYTKRKSFPYYDLDDFFRNIITNYNVEYIIESNILDQEKFNLKLIEKEDEIYDKVRTILTNDAKVFTKRLMLFVVVVIIFIYGCGSLMILKGDWNYFEPKTFILFGTPMLVYLISIIYFLITDKELKLSPAKVSKKIEERRYNKLSQKFKIKENNNLLVD